MTLPPGNGLKVNLEAVARSSKTIEGKNKCWTFIHCSFHILIIAAALGVIYWGLILGKSFLSDEVDYHKNPTLPLFRPPTEENAEEATSE